MDELWTASLVMLWLVVAGMAFLLVGALRQLGLIALRLGDDPGALVTDAGLDRGTVLPRASALDAESGTSRDVTSRFGPRNRLIVFVTPTCLSCRQLVPHLNEVAETRAGSMEFLTICRGDVESCQTFRRTNRLQTEMLIDTTGEVETRFEIRFTPFAYHVDTENRVLIRGVINDWRQIESLLDQEGTLQPGTFQLVDDQSSDGGTRGLVFNE